MLVCVGDDQGVGCGYVWVRIRVWVCMGEDQGLGDDQGVGMWVRIRVWVFMGDDLSVGMCGWNRVWVYG